MQVAKAQLLRHAEVVIEPIKRVLLNPRKGKNVATVHERVPLVGIGHAEEPEHWLLRCFDREREVVPAVQHHTGVLAWGAKLI
jgi:hypothetical protein